MSWAKWRRCATGVAILHEGKLRVEGRVSDLVQQYQCNLEHVFLNIVGYKPES